MAQYFKEPYPARAAVGVAALPRGAQVEMDAVMVLGDKIRRKGAKGAKKPKSRTKKRR